MKLNLEFYDNYDENLSKKDLDILNIVQDNNKEEKLNSDNTVNTYVNLTDVKENLLNWYDFNKDASILEIGSNFGELTSLFSKSCREVKLIEFSKKKAEYIENKFSSIENIEIIVGKLENIKFKQKFDYIVITTSSSDVDVPNSLEFAKKHLKENGVIFLAVDNKYGIKNWKGTDDYKALQDNYSRREFGKKSLESLINEFEFNNSKFFYIFPEFRAPNIIYTDNHKITSEDISRNFELNEIEDENCFGENDVLNSVFKDNSENINFFANSFLMIISNNVINDDTKYITFSNYRMEDKRIQTIIKNDKVLKRATNENAKKHIENIINNFQYFPQNCMLLDRKKDEYTIESDFIVGKRLDEIIEFSEKPEVEFDNYSKLIFNNVLKYDEVEEKGLLKLFENYDKEILKKLNFIEYAFIDMIPKNCFVVGGVNFFFDQEWMLKYIPAEYILFRAIKNTTNIDKDKLYEYYNLLEYMDLFNEIEDYFRDMVIDKKLLFNVFSKVNNLKIQRPRQLQEEINKKNDLLKKQEIEISANNDHIQELENTLQDRENQLAVIRKSISWKITIPIRAISKFIRKIFRS